MVCDRFLSGPRALSGDQPQRVLRTPPRDGLPHPQHHEAHEMHAVMNSRKTKVAGFLGTVAITGGLVASAVVGTGAYFSDTKTDNHITGTMGSIKVEGHDGDGTNKLDVVFTDMLPGETKSAKLRYSNTGKNAQDVWVVFKGAGLGTGDGNTGINSLGAFAEVHVASNGTE